MMKYQNKSTSIVSRPLFLLLALVLTVFLLIWAASNNRLSSSSSSPKLWIPGVTVPAKGGKCTLAP